MSFDATGHSQFNLGISNKARKKLYRDSLANKQANVNASLEATQARVYRAVSERINATYTGEGMTTGHVAMPHVVTYTAKAANGHTLREAGLAGSVMRDFEREYYSKKEQRFKPKQLRIEKVLNKTPE